MAERDKEKHLPPTLSLIFDDLKEKLSKHSDIDEEVVQKLDDFLRSGDFPGPDELYRALFPTPSSKESGTGDGK